MQASRVSCFHQTKTVALALSFSFLCGPLVLANPDSSHEKGAANTGPGAPVGSSEKSLKLGSSSGTGNSSVSDSNAVEIKTENSADKNADLATDTRGSASKIKEEAPSQEKLHDIGVLHWNLSKKYSKDGDLDLAETELDLAVMNWPDMKIAHRDLCLISLMRFNLLRSVAEFMMTVGLCDAVPMTEEESSNLLEDGMVKHYKKGLVYARQQDWSKTVMELELAAHLISDDFAVQRALAFAYASQGNFSKAEEHYKTTFELSPHDGSSRADLAYLLARNGKIGEAEKEMEEAVKSQPKAAAYHVDLSWMAETRGDLDTASKELQEAVALSPKHADLWARLGRLLEHKGARTEAVDAYTRAISLNPALADAREALAKLQGEGNPQAPEIITPARTTPSRT